MAVDQPLTEPPATDLSMRDSDEIQGDVLAGFKKDQMVLLFLKFEDGIRARTWLQRLTPRIATTRQVATFNKAFSAARQRSGGDPTGLKATWLGISFTYKGLQKLTDKEPCPAAAKDTSLGAFQQGPVDRAGILGDTGANSPSGWIFGNNKTEESIHAVLTIAADTVEDLRAAVTEQREAAAQCLVSVIFQQDCATLPGSRRGKEHFGFKDGVSEPGVRGFDDPDPLRPEWVKGHPGTRLIPAGEFVAGYPQIDRSDIGGPTKLPAWAFNGSFQVVRRLGQDVPGWWAQVARQLPILKEKKAVPDTATIEWLAARVVGRWRSGTPVAKCPAADTPFNTVASNDNDISFGNDLNGKVTPLWSHLRKTNPRDGLQERPGDPVQPEDPVMDRRRIMRRGSPYGHPFDPAVEGPGGPDAPRGLLFVSYQTDIVTQFEFIQQLWIDSPSFPPNRKNPPGPDAMVGATGTVTWDQDGDNPVPLGFQQFVRTEGCVYAFAPSMTVLRSLGEGRLPDHGLPEIGQPVDTFLPVADLQRKNGKSFYWAYRTVGGKQQYRVISIADGDAHTDVLEKADRPVSEWDSLDGVSSVDFYLPYPDMQRKDGKSWYWVFHTVDNQQIYRVVTIADDDAHTDVMERGDGPISRWASLRGVTKVDFVLPMPDFQRKDGKSWYWLFHTVDGQQVYRMISIADGTRHTDVMERGDRRISLWGSFAGIDRVTTVLPMPDRQRVNGLSTYWVFHQDKYRIVTIADGDAHTDRLVVPDRSVSLWKSLGQIS
ncbi:Dyp-type peroxidase [Kitasatospora sp. McL0602]|uniref:Dyp-type peroxidase n=1 Tax=Kitasatospora sp. McL0602 TaxID=3439530 RepID=UPI003F8C753E